VTLPEDKVPSKKMVRDIMGVFLTEEWPFVGYTEEEEKHFCKEYAR